jgi:RNA polymerase sigma-70 factor (ECF subfamily)
MDEDRPETPGLFAAQTSPGGFETAEGVAAPTFAEITISATARSDPASAIGHLDRQEAVARSLEFTLFYESDMPALVAFLSVHGARLDEAAEVAQVAMAQAWWQWDSIDHPRAWVRVVAPRIWWKRIDGERRESPCAEVPERSCLLSQQESDEVEARHTLIALLRPMPMRQRQILAWTYDGYAPAEIAELLKLSPEAVRANLYKARQALKRTAGRETP